MAMDEISWKEVQQMKKDDKKRYIFRRYITKNGVRIYPKNGKVFKIPVED